MLRLYPVDDQDGINPTIQKINHTKLKLMNTITVDLRKLAKIKIRRISGCNVGLCS